MRIKGWIAAAVLVAASGPAMAACYEGIGCTDGDTYSKSDLRQLSCQALWDVRNTIYKENGYCFKTAKAINYFGNAGCWTDDQGAVKLNAYERQNVAAIQSVEREKRCK